ncbi:MAG: hypothetical protein ACOYOA_00020 [Saprospiraceae bacterium]
MLKNYILVLFLAFFHLFLFGQKSLSYINDRKFFDPTDLLGYNFRPAILEIKDIKKQNLVPGSYAFGITPNNLYVEGEGIAGVFNVNNINSTEFGFKLMLMNARDPTLQGHLKIILNKRGEVEALVFLRSPKDKEMIFYISALPAELGKKESAYFTDRNELELLQPDSLWRKIIRPFITIHQDNSIQDRIQMKDSVSFMFVEKIKIIDKSKKKDSKTDSTKVSYELKDMKIDSIQQTEISKETVKKPDVKKDVKIIKEHFVYFRSIFKYDDGTEEDKETEYIIKKCTLKEDKKMDPAGDRFLLQIETNKGDMNLFLNGQKTLNSIEFNNKIYLMRGF